MGRRLEHRARGFLSKSERCLVASLAVPQAVPPGKLATSSFLVRAGL